MSPATDPPPAARPALPVWRRLAVRLAVAFALLTFLSVSIVGVLVRERQKRELEDAVGTQLLNIARVAGLFVDPRQPAEPPRAPRPAATAYRRPRAPRATAFLSVDYQVDVFLDRLRELDVTILEGSAAGALCALVLGLLFARRLTRPISALTTAVARVAGGDLSQPALPVRSRDEVGLLTGAFNGMVEGLRQRDFIRNAFGRYVSPEGAKTLLESPDC